MNQNYQHLPEFQVIPSRHHGQRNPRNQNYQTNQNYQHLPEFRANPSHHHDLSYQNYRTNQNYPSYQLHHSNRASPSVQPRKLL
jgi:hypothetical protein